MESIRTTITLFKNIKGNFPAGHIQTVSFFSLYLCTAVKLIIWDTNTGQVPA